MSQPMAILIDVTRCTGCEACVSACKKENGLGEDLPRRWKQRIDDLSATRYTTIARQPDNHFVRRLCRHCIEPACVSACIVGALTKTEEGPVVYDPKKCIGCRYCMMACPYGIPRYDWEQPTPYVKKCTLCYPRLQEGRIPACVEACPYEATFFGPRDEMLSVAHDLIKTEPDRYLPKVYGEHEIGGTSVLYISDISLDFLAFRPELGDEPLPQLTWAALSKVPPIVAGVGCIMTGVWWVVNRRMQLAEEKHSRNTKKEREACDS